MDDQNRILAGLILNCKPEDLKGIAQKTDGSLAVVAPNGMKFVFSPAELDNARDSFCLPVIPLAEHVEANERTEHTPPTPHTSTGSVSGSGSSVRSDSSNGIPLAEPVEASEHGTANPHISVPARQISPHGTEASSVTEPPMASTGTAIGQTSHRRRKETHA